MFTPIEAEILDIVIPFRFTFRHALASRSEGHSILLRLIDGEGRVGHGESAPREYVTGETTETVRGYLDSVLPALLGKPLGTIEEVTTVLEGLSRDLARTQHAAFCALELALLDLAGRAFGISAGIVLGPILSPVVHYSGVVSADGVKEALGTCELMKKFAFKSVKLKVGTDLETDLQILEGARAILGGACSLRVDANCAWDLETALARLEAFESFRLDGIEQPLPAEDLGGLAQLTARSQVPIIADESLVSAEDARRLAERRACHLFNIRISKCGGIMNSARIGRTGREAGIGCMLGAQVGETGVLSAAGRHFGTRFPDVRFFEGSYGTLLLEQDVTVQDLTIQGGGIGSALDGPGLGVDVDESRLQSFVARRTRVGSGTPR